MRYTIYEDRRTRKFAFLALPGGFVAGDELPAVSTDQWFASREEAIAALGDLLNRYEPDSGIDARIEWDDTTPRTSDNVH